MSILQYLDREDRLKFEFAFAVAAIGWVVILGLTYLLSKQVGANAGIGFFVIVIAALLVGSEGL